MEPIYNHHEIEEKWQKFWETNNFYRAKDTGNDRKFYCLLEFPYPSGDGLHVGHLRSFSALDAVARYHRAKGDNVLFPMGWDAFGLPTENYAIKMKTHPAEVTAKNIANFKRQLRRMGFSFDWSREINTTDPAYYKWTQWIFLQLFKRDLAYRAKTLVNWCPSCKIVLANEEVVNGGCERCGHETTRQEKEQWLLKITAYAERLINDLETVDYLEKIKTQQVNWIGRSEGAMIMFPLMNRQSSSKKQRVIEVFTTRPDTLFGVTYLVVSPEHAIVDDKRIENRAEVNDYVREARGKSEMERTSLNKVKSGVELKGVSVAHPVTKEPLPVWVADYVLAGYGTGAVMAVPAHDERDFDFAFHRGLPIKSVIEPPFELSINNNRLFRPAKASRITAGDPTELQQKESLRGKINNLHRGQSCYIGEGKLIESGEFSGLTTAEAKEKMIQWLEKAGLGKREVTYKLRDWIFSRQHYWGEPIPIIHCATCGQVPVPEEDLPVELPYVENYEPTETGESPLAAMIDWVSVRCPKCGGGARRETDTMPNWAGSSWYFLRYIDPRNNEALADKAKLRYWLPVDLYNGGMEHTTLHLLYSRFWHKFLYDIEAVPTPEPYQSRRSHGMVLAADHQKMSKSRGNVIGPDEIVADYGADAVRLYEMFMGPFGETIPWQTEGLVGVRRFLEKTWRLVYEHVSRAEDGASRNETTSLSTETARILHKTIKKVGEDLENMRFNTAVSALMILVNELKDAATIDRGSLKIMTQLLAPFAPHLAEELWLSLGAKESVTLAPWPVYDPALVKDKEIELVVQVNGKLRGKLTVSSEIDEQEATRLAAALPAVQSHLADQRIKKTVFIPGRLINFVIV